MVLKNNSMYLATPNNSCHPLIRRKRKREYSGSEVDQRKKRYLITKPTFHFCNKGFFHFAKFVYIYVVEAEANRLVFLASDNMYSVIDDIIVVFCCPLGPSSASLARNRRFHRRRLWPVAVPVDSVECAANGARDAGRPDCRRQRPHWAR